MDLEWWQIILGVIVGLFLLMVLVIVHELGHAIAAIRNGVEVEEFGLGFPPRAKILGKIRIPAGKKFREVQEKNGKTLLTINWLLPLGGFCKMKGESDDARGKGTYGAALFWAKTKILFAGVMMNLVAAMVIFSILALTGMPKIFASQFAIAADNYGDNGTVAVVRVVENSPAEKAGIKKGDVITEVATIAPEGYSATTHEIHMTSDLSDLTKSHAGEKVIVGVTRNGQDLAANGLSVTLAKNSATGALGVVTEQKTNATIRATWSAPIVGVVNTLQFIWMTLVGLVGLLGNLVTGLVGLVVHNPDAGAQLGAAGDSVAGPVGILGNIFPHALMAGPTQLFWLMGIISLTLTVMNLLPIPGLDGGRWALTAWYHARKKPLTKEKEEKIVGNGMLVLFALIILITITDVWKMF